MTSRVKLGLLLLGGAAVLVARGHHVSTPHADHRRPEDDGYGAMSRALGEGRLGVPEGSLLAGDHRGRRVPGLVRDAIGQRLGM